MDATKLSEILDGSPSVELLKLRNRNLVVVFLANAFANQQDAIADDRLHRMLADYLEAQQLEVDEETEIVAADNYEAKAKKYIYSWTNKGFLTNYKDERGEVFYELSVHSGKLIDWLWSLKKEAFIGTESKFKNIFSQLQELVEFTNEDKAKRIRLLEERKLEIEQQIDRIKAGEDIKVFEDFEIVPRFKQLNHQAKELLTDFKEVEGNFKDITKLIYKKHAEGDARKSEILELTFDAIDELKESQQGKSFYAFYSFLLSAELQNQWDELTEKLYHALEAKAIPVTDNFLKQMRKHLHRSGQKVYKANDRMAEKLSRIIRENDTSISAATKTVIQEIKKQLVQIGESGTRPDASLDLETDFLIRLPFERKLTFTQKADTIYDHQPSLASSDIADANQINRLFNQTHIDKTVILQRINDLLDQKSQTTIREVIDSVGGLEKGLAELFAYISVAKNFKHDVSDTKTDRIVFDREGNKTIKVPEIILVR